MGLGNRRSETSCFCSLGCPAGTFPFRQYFVTTPTTPGPNYGGVHYLFRYTTIAGNACIWDSVADHFIGPSTERLFWNPINLGPDSNEYNVELTLITIGGINTWRQTFSTALPEPPGQVEPNAPTSCSRMRILLPHVILGVLSIAELTPAYPDACDDADYPAKQQTKFLASY